jgi:hypothetical protein
VRGLVAIACLAAFPAVAEGGPTDAQIAAFLKAAADAGCAVNSTNKDAILKAAGLSEEEGTAVVIRLMDTGKAADAGDDVIQVFAEGCE